VVGLLARSLWEASGHWAKFGQTMFALAQGEREWALKPMSRPGHIQIFNHRVHWFRDLPLRFSEFGACHLQRGIGRAAWADPHPRLRRGRRACLLPRGPRREQGGAACALLRRIYADFGFADLRLGISTRRALRAGRRRRGLGSRRSSACGAARAAGLDVVGKPGEGAFCGSKLEYGLRDGAGRVWQCGTIQVDFVLPELLEANFVDEHNARPGPVIMHHAVLGSPEPFIAVLLEHYAGNLPGWLAPEQICCATISEDQSANAQRAAAILIERGYRDGRAKRLARKIVDARERGSPVLLALGRRNAAAEIGALRRRDGRLQSLPLAAVAEALRGEAFR
jgi:threonyl-tRNA synthetase